MFLQFKYRMNKGPQMAAVGMGVAIALLLAVLNGAFEGLELGILDRFFRLRSAEATDPRILVVTIGEDDLSAVGHWPISDATLAELVRQINQHEPAAIGLDLYRNFPVEPGVDELIEVFERSPNVIGIERVIGEPVPAHQTLIAVGQTAAADFVMDDDGRVRRGLLSVIAPTGEVKQGLAAALSLDYLSDLGIEPEALAGRRLALQLGKARIERFEKNGGSYVDADAGGYQVLMNYRGDSRQFDSISMTAVLAGELTDERVQGRIVLVGSTAVSLNDLFYSPPGGTEQIAGVYIHAHLVSQLLRAALDGEPFLRTVPDAVEWLWTALWIAASIGVSRSVLYSRSLQAKLPMWQLVIRLVGVAVSLAMTGYGLFLAGWWLPLALPTVAMVATTVLGVAYRNAQLQTLAAFDELTRVANRRYFDQYLANALNLHKELSLILCDVDYFKAYNDRYGHPAGDRCLQQVAQAIQLAVRDSDLVARYGGEEFVIVLPETTPEIAADIAERIQHRVRRMEIVHEGSQVSQWVTLSCGSANVSPGFCLSPLRLIEYADKALYVAKQSGRNQLVISQWQTSAREDTHPGEAA
jgi:diguanylate cyclase (GGDEF)-like protein